MAVLDNSWFDSNVLPSLGETLKAFGDVGPADWMMVFGAALWLVILNLSLLAIDRRDRHAGMTYMMFMLAAGVTLIIALPSRLRPTMELRRSHLWTCAVLLLITAMRWALRPATSLHATAAAAAPAAKEKTDE